MQMYIVLSAAFMTGLSISIKVNDFNKAFKKAADNFEKIRKDRDEHYFVVGRWFGPIWTVCLVYNDFTQIDPTKMMRMHHFLSVTQYKLWMIRHYGKVE